MSVTAAEGFVAAAGSAGIKAGGAPDVAVVATANGHAVPAAGVFTSNLAAAAPVQVSREHLSLSSGHAAGVILTSGNANAATGKPGHAAAALLCGAVAEGIGAAPSEVLVCQTGLIGPLPHGPRRAPTWPASSTHAPGEDAGAAAARAIMTTDTVPKTALYEAGGFTVGAMAKGAAMLAPNMATMLALCTTDAVIDPDTLYAALKAAVDRSFNVMTVDGCTSTNDTVLVLASGAAGPATLEEMTVALGDVCRSLAEQMVNDAEGATKVSHVRVVGAQSDAAAHVAARKVADSMLVQCSLNGEDPYWGRVVSELGSAGVSFDMDKVAVAYGGVTVCEGGVEIPHDASAVSTHMAGRHIEILCDLGLGGGAAAVLGTDLGYGYIDENRTTS